MNVSELDTPALLIDLDVMERNLEHVAGYAREHGLRMRPHTKTHKIPALARRQIALGAAGLSVAKVGEAEVMIAAEPPELLVAYPVLGWRKLDRLLPLARRTRVTVSLDSATAARQLSEAAREARVEVGILAEADVGLGRMGLQPGAELIELAKCVDSLSCVRLDGFTFYPGHIKSMNGDGEQAVKKLADVVAGIRDDFDRAGLCRDVVSGGSTPTLFHSHLVTGLNEIRPGTYIFNDRNTVACGSSSLEDCAASIMVTVISTARANGMMVDGGSKTFFSDKLITGGDDLFGHVVDAPQARFFRMNEEHGYIDLSDAERGFQIGNRVRIIPNHVCVAMNLHEWVYGVRGEQVEQVWKVEGRGKLQ